MSQHYCPPRVPFAVRAASLLVSAVFVMVALATVLGAASRIMA